MCGFVDRQQSVFIVLYLESMIPSDHPLRAIKARGDRLLAAMSRDFDKAYGNCGRVGIPPESMLKCLLLCALFGIPGDRRLCEACQCNLLYRWFIDWPIEKTMWTPEAFSMNRERFESCRFVRKFFDRVVPIGSFRA